MFVICEAQFGVGDVAVRLTRPPAWRSLIYKKIKANFREGIYRDAIM